MSVTHSIGVVYKSDAGTIASVTDTYTDDFEVAIDHATAAATTNEEIDIALTVANIKSMLLYSDQTVTVKTNSTVAVQTLTLTAKKAVVWATDHIETCPLTSNVTKIFVTNSGSSAANLKFRFLLDQVP